MQRNEIPERTKILNEVISSVLDEFKYDLSFSEITPYFVRMTLEHCFDAFEFRRDATEFLSNTIESLYPTKERDDEHPFYNPNTVHDHCWMMYRAIDDAWEKLNGRRRTLEESCMLAADTWMDIIFGDFLERNFGGNDDFPVARFYYHDADPVKVRSKISQETKDRLKELLYGVYMSILKHDREWHSNIIPFKKDSLTKTLFESWSMGDMCTTTSIPVLFSSILTTAGIPAKVIYDLCPLGIGVTIDNLDFSITIKVRMTKQIL